jgi:hypothetical protein
MSGGKAMGSAKATKVTPTGRPPTEAELKRKVRDLTKHLKDLTASVGGFLARLDIVMEGPSTEARGKRVAELTNQLEMANDRARFFGLGINYRGDNKRKGKIMRAAKAAEGE